MNGEVTVESQSQSFWQKAANKKNLFLIFGIILVFIFASVIYIGNKQEKLPQTTPQPTPAASRVEDQIILKFKPEVSESTKIEILKKYNATIIKRIDAIHRIVIRVPKGQEDAILEQMKKDNLIENAEPNYILKIFYTPNDPSLNLQWGLENTGQTIKGQAGIDDADIDAEAAWNTTLGNGVKIAVLDTGIDTTHPDLSSKIIAQKNFTGGTETDVKDLNGHGTHTAGIAAAITNNSTGVAGTCPDCQLIIGKVMDTSGSGEISWIIEGIIWAADNGAKVISLSLGGPYNTTSQQDAIDYAWNKGAVIVAAAGNDSSPYKNYPGANNNVVSVAATDNRDEMASFSNYGTWVDVAAPGMAIYSTLPTYEYDIRTSRPNMQLNYDFLSGTSMATPMAAGVIGLIWSTSYGTSNTSVINRLFDSTDKISGTGTYWKYGRVNAGLAVSNGVSVIPTATNTPIPTSTNAPTPTIINPCPSGSVASTCINTPTPTRRLTPTPTPSSAPTPRYVTPTIYCIGSCPTEIPTPTPRVSTTPPVRLPISTPTIGATPTYPPGVTPYSPYWHARLLPPCDSYGDVDMDGFVSQEDADMIINARGGWVTLTLEQVRRADVNGNGQVEDYSQVDGDWKYIVDYLNSKQITTFPICSTLTPTPSIVSTNSVSPKDQQSWWEILLKFIGFK